MKLKAFKYCAIATLSFSGLVSCVADDNSPGLEYMPDMYRSPAVEAYVDNGEVEGRYDEAAQDMVKEKFSFLPPAGTVPYWTGENADVMYPYNHGAPVNSDKTHGLYGYAQSVEGRDAAKNDINPIPYTKEVADEGKVIFGRFCIHCHGEKGDGQGTVVTNSGDKFPSPGAYKKEVTPGEIFYTITYGKGAMGSHASQLNPIERWKVTHYVEKLAGVEKEIEEPLLYDANTDTDGDGVMDNLDECPRISGSKENNGCPDVSAETKTVLSDAIRGLVFETGSDAIAGSSFTAIDKVVALMEANPDHKLIINGHTDNIGGWLPNQWLSHKRARSVKAYLADKGIEKNRINAVGYGQSKPIADNATEEGRQKNRRVEFRIYN
ncbi:OmpA family protein [Crocinitomix catalasitica]|uniref:OmpA family protein n=1 Tax=Crocinitomix catalasitica TaxID=184607 RepID=UPI000684C74C|nr:OmpA family protein [Crocinitomix catalasitica]